MTLEEQQHLSTLKRLLATKGRALKDMEYHKLVEDITGNSHDYIRKTLISKGYLKEGNNFVDQECPRNTVYRIYLSDMGEKAYFNLRKKKRNELYQQIAVWTTLILAFLCALFGILTYYE